MDCSGMRAIPRAHPRGTRALSVRPPPRRRGTRDQEQSPALASAAGTAALCSSPGPSRPRQVREGKARRVARRMRASSLPVQGRTVSEPRSALAESPGRTPGDRGREGALLFGYFLLGKHCAAGAARTAKPARRAEGRMPGVKRSNSAARMAGEAHRDVSRVSACAEDQKRKLDPGLRRDDGGVSAFR